MVRAIPLALLLVSGCKPLGQGRNTPVAESKAAELQAKLDETPWAAVVYSEDDKKGMVMGRFHDLETCRRIDSLWNRVCQWERFGKSQVLNCTQAGAPDGPKVTSTCEKR
jgi:hypothetical protein